MASWAPLSVAVMCQALLTTVWLVRPSSTAQVRPAQIQATGLLLLTGRNRPSSWPVLTVCFASMACPCSTQSFIDVKENRQASTWQPGALDNKRSSRILLGISVRLTLGNHLFHVFLAEGTPERPRDTKKTYREQELQVGRRP